MSETGNTNIDKMYQALNSGKQKYFASILQTASLITSVVCFVTLNKYCHKVYMRLLTQAVNTHTYTVALKEQSILLFVSNSLILTFKYSLFFCSCSVAWCHILRCADYLYYLS
jgi:ABC-type uncharacterized transport system permease subunit